MKLKKTLCSLLSACLAVSAFALPLSAEEIKYHCEWADVRPECNYELTIEKVNVDGEDMCKIRLSGILEELVEKEYGFTFEYQEGEFTIKGSMSVNMRQFYVDVDGGKEQLKFTIYENTDGYVKSLSIYEMLSPTTEPDENGEYCFVEEYINSSRTSYVSDVDMAKDENDNYYLEACVSPENKYVKSLMECESTTVMTTGLTEMFSTTYDADGNWRSTGSSDFVTGFLSDGTVIKGDGKYIDCCTGKELNPHLSERECELAVDNITEVPKETLKVNVIGVDSEETTSENTTEPENTTEETTIETIVTEAETANTPTQTITDSESGISVSGNIAEDTALKIVKGDTNATSATFDISLVYKDGKTVQPNGNIKVKIPVPEGLKAEDCKVYRAEADGSYTDMKAKLDNGCLVFTTDRFSKYVVSTIALGGEKDENLPTGVAIAIAPVIIAALGALAAKKRK